MNFNRIYTECIKLKESANPDTIDELSNGYIIVSKRNNAFFPLDYNIKFNAKVLYSTTKSGEIIFATPLKSTPIYPHLDNLNHLKIFSSEEEAQEALLSFNVKSTDRSDNTEEAEEAYKNYLNENFEVISVEDYKDILKNYIREKRWYSHTGF